MINLVSLFNEKKIVVKLINLKNVFQAHPFHLVDNSPWPISISWTLFYMAIGAVLSMQGFVMGPNLLLLGLLSTTIIIRIIKYNYNYVFLIWRC